MTNKSNENRDTRNIYQISNRWKKLFLFGYVLTGTSKVILFKTVKIIENIISKLEYWSTVH